MERVKNRIRVQDELMFSVGNTPLIDLSEFSLNPNVKISAKAEFRQMGGNMHARKVALAMVDYLNSEEAYGRKSICDSVDSALALAYAVLAASIGLELYVEPRFVLNSHCKVLLKLLKAKVINRDVRLPLETYFINIENRVDLELQAMEAIAIELKQVLHDDISHFVYTPSKSFDLELLGRIVQEHFSTVEVLGEAINTESQTLEKELKKQHGLSFNKDGFSSLSSAIKLSGKIQSGHIVFILTEDANSCP